MFVLVRESSPKSTQDIYCCIRPGGWMCRLQDESALYRTSDVSKPCHQRWAVSREASLEIWVLPLDREKGSILRGRGGETQNGLFHNRLTDLLALSSWATLTENQGEKGKECPALSLPPISNSLISPVCLSRPSSFLLILLPIRLYPAFLKNPLNPCTPAIVSRTPYRAFDVLISCFFPHPRLSYPSSALLELIASTNC